MDSGVKRIITALIGIPVVIAPMYFGGLWFTFFVAVVAVAGQYELYRLEAKLSWVPATVLGMAGGLLVVFRDYSDLVVPMLLGFTIPVLEFVFLEFLMSLVRVGMSKSGCNPIIDSVATVRI